MDLPGMCFKKYPTLDTNRRVKYQHRKQNSIGLHRILSWPDIRQIFLPDIQCGRISGIRSDIRLNSNIEFASEKNVPLFSFQQICLQLCYILI